MRKSTRYQVSSTTQQAALALVRLVDAVIFIFFVPVEKFPSEAPGGFRVEPDRVSRGGISYRARSRFSWGGVHFCLCPARVGCVV